MTDKLTKLFQKPIINLTILLFDELMKAKSLAPKNIQNAILSNSLKSAHMLMVQSLRQLNGKSNTNRIIEIVDDIRADIYLSYSLKGLSKTKCAFIDKLLSDILSNIYSITRSSKGQDH